MTRGPWPDWCEIREGDLDLCSESNSLPGDEDRKPYQMMLLRGWEGLFENLQGNKVINSEPLMVKTCQPGKRPGV